MTDLLTSDTALTLLGTTLGGLWAFFRASEFYAGISSRRYARAVEALEAGVEQTYRTYVNAIKEAREDGKLTESEQRNARALARQTAVEFARREGIDIAHELGEEYINLWIARLVKKLKQE